jgi:hypothetical protein
MPGNHKSPSQNLPVTAATRAIRGMFKPPIRSPVENSVENFCQEAKMKIVCNSLWNQRKKLCAN